MKLRDILSPVLSAILAVLIFSALSSKGCIGNQPTPTPPDSPTEALLKLEANARNVDSILFVINANQGTLASLFSKADTSDRELIGRIVSLEKEMRSQGRKLESFVSSKSETRLDWSDEFKELTEAVEGIEIPANANGVASFNDDWVKNVVFKIGDTDSVGVFLNVRNEFELAEFTENGERMARITNLNPYTTTMPGTNLFRLSAYGEAERKKWRLKFGGGALYDGGFRPFVFTTVSKE